MLDTTSQALQVLLVADPGLPSRRAASIHTTLERYLREAYGVTTTLHTHTDTIRLTPERELALGAVEDLRDDYPDVNIILLLTEIPRHTQGDPLIAEVHSDRNLAVVSCPTLGAWATKRRIVKVMMSSVNKLVPPLGPGSHDPQISTRVVQLVEQRRLPPSVPARPHHHRRPTADLGHDDCQRTLANGSEALRSTGGSLSHRSLRHLLQFDLADVDLPVHPPTAVDRRCRHPRHGRLVDRQPQTLGSTGQ